MSRHITEQHYLDYRVSFQLTLITVTISIVFNEGNSL